MLYGVYPSILGEPSILAWDGKRPLPLQVGRSSDLPKMGLNRDAGEYSLEVDLRSAEGGCGEKRLAIRTSPTDFSAWAHTGRGSSRVGHKRRLSGEGCLGPSLCRRHSCDRTRGPQRDGNARPCRARVRSVPGKGCGSRPPGQTLRLAFRDMTSYEHLGFTRLMCFFAPLFLSGGNASRTLGEKSRQLFQVR